jgi:hypothetical protein
MTTSISATNYCLSATTPSSSCEPYNATLGDNTTLGDDNAKLGNNFAMPLLTTAARTTTTAASIFTKHSCQFLHL